MSVRTFLRDLQKIPEAIPTPGAIIYNAVPARLLQAPERKLAEAIAGKLRGGTLIDLGAGTGYLSIEIAKRVPALKVCGIDLSKEMVKIARRHAEGVENVRFEVGNAADLPFEDASIDYIVSTGSLHHWKKPARIFDECYRVLKSGKEAWIYDGCPDIPRDEADRLKKEYGPLRYRVLVNLLHFHGFSKQEYDSKIRDMLEQTKFKNSYHMEPAEVFMKITVKKRT
jgi:ubiquinone/menaquinone biosynthesis C-methylase UbiE